MSYTELCFLAFAATFIACMIWMWLWYKVEKITWISVEDELPAPGEQVLCYGQTTLNLLLQSKGGKPTFWYEVCKLATEDGQCYADFGVTHWMPLPSPPESNAKAEGCDNVVQNERGKMTHTPGPWYCDTGCGCKAIGPATGVFGKQVGEAIADTVGLENEAEDLANAQLIASAPELLEACKVALAFIIDGECSYDAQGNEWPEVTQIRDAIDKTEGRE